MQVQQYISFTKKYRPKNFSEIYSQDVLVKILTHSIIHNRIAQSYLLTGIRGVGKTTIARIISKTINCTHPIIDSSHINVCEQCKNCQSINKGNHPDLIEIDAASKANIEEIKSIIEKCIYKPLLAKYRVFIIDEVHMLSKAGFNALLKILEEPPDHVIFIFATTEVASIPMTFVSRCQRYDLHRFTLDNILQLLNKITKEENINIDQDALKIIAHKSYGSAREAVMILDQAVNFCMLQSKNHIITKDMINQILGLVGIDIIIQFLQYILDSNAEVAIELVQSIYYKSIDLSNFIESVSDVLIYLNKSKLIDNYTETLYDSLNNEITQILSKTSLSKLSVLWQMFYKAISEVRSSNNALIYVEMLIIKAIYSHKLPSPEELIPLKNNHEKDGHYINSDTSNTITQLLSLSNDDKISIANFLKHLHQSNEFSIYYLLFNEVEIQKFSDNTMIIAANNIDSKMKIKLQELLNEYNGQVWSVQVQQQNQIVSIKSQIITKFQSNKNWLNIINSFPNAMISDILLKI